MPLPRIYRDSIHMRMAILWSLANRSWEQGNAAFVAAYMREYDYLSHYQNEGEWC